jgi:TldD protein
MDRTQLLTAALELAVDQGAAYAESRLARTEQEVLKLLNGEVDDAFNKTSAGLGVRVLVDGAWGFAAAAETGKRDLPSLVGRAVAIARASASHRREPVVFSPAAATVAEHRDTGRRDPFTIPMTERLALLRDAHAAMEQVDSIVRTQAQMDIRREQVGLMTTEGTYILQEIGVVGGGLSVVAEVDGTRAARSYPHHGGWDYAVGGYEWLEDLQLVNEGARIADEAVTLTKARACPRTVTTVVVDPTVLGMILHETMGHASELDRALGDELDNFGPSFLTPDKLDRYPYGSPCVSISADATQPGAAGSFGFDDEGTPAQRFPLVSNGVFRGYLMSRESAAHIGRVSNGAARASSWNRIPMPRITNIILEPGESSLDQLISEVDEGVYIQTWRTSDIDDKRLLCSFSGEIGWEIHHGRLRDPIRTPVMFASTPSLWRQCDGIGSREESRIIGITECGKGQPWQFVRTGQGGPPARFRNVQVGLPEGV